jgi:outer membrane protein TolC
MFQGPRSWARFVFVPEVRTFGVRGALMVTLAFVASAAGAQTTRLTLEQAQQRALEASHRLAEVRARESAAVAGVAQRVAEQQPIVGASGGYTRTNHVRPFVVPGPGPVGIPQVIYPDVPDNYFSRVDLQWSIYTGGRTDALERAARAEASAVAADVLTTRADLRLEVARAFWAVVTARAAAAVLQRSVDRMAAHVDETNVRFTNGLIPPNELASADAQHAREVMLLTEAQGQENIAIADLARLVNAGPGETVVPEASLEAPPPAGTLVQGEMQLLLDRARANRTEREAMARRIDAAVEQQAAARSGKHPTVSVGAGFDYARPNPKIFPRAERWDDSWDAGVSVSWPFWDGGRTAADVARTSALATAARERLAEFDSVLAVDVRQRAVEVDTAHRVVAAAGVTVTAAAEARRVVAERFAVGVATQTEVLDAEVDLLQAELERTRALANLRLADARLARATGQ